MVVMNSHDGSSGIKVAMTPIRVVCQNTLNLALNNAKRIWTTKHTENVMNRVHEARETLILAESYMGELGKGINDLTKIRLTDKKVMEFMEEFFPVTGDMPEVQRKNNRRLLEDMKLRYFMRRISPMLAEMATASSMQSAISPPTPIRFARPRTTTRTYSCAPLRAIL